MNGIIGIVKLGNLFVKVVLVFCLVGNKLWMKLIIVWVFKFKLCISVVIVIIVIKEVGIVVVSLGSK